MHFPAKPGTDPAFGFLDAARERLRSGSVSVAPLGRAQCPRKVQLRATTVEFRYAE